MLFIQSGLLKNNPCGGIEKLPIEQKAKSLPSLEDFMDIREVANEMERYLRRFASPNLGSDRGTFGFEVG